jgi:signal transduction histidine kinase
MFVRNDANSPNGFCQGSGKEGMKTMCKKILVVLFICLSMAGSVYAQEKGTAAEAKSLLDDAVAYYKANGQEKAFAAFDDPKGKFVNKDLYIFTLDMNGKVLAHGADAALIGKDMMGTKDADGKLFIKEMIEIARTKGKGVVDYKWWKPDFRFGYRPDYDIAKVEQKSSYVEKVDSVVMGCGYYKASKQGESM